MEQIHPNHVRQLQWLTMANIRSLSVIHTSRLEVLKSKRERHTQVFFSAGAFLATRIFDVTFTLSFLQAAVVATAAFVLVQWCLLYFLPLLLVYDCVCVCVCV